MKPASAAPAHAAASVPHALQVCYCSAALHRLALPSLCAPSCKATAISLQVTNAFRSASPFAISLQHSESVWLLKFHALVISNMQHRTMLCAGAASHCGAPKGTLSSRPGPALSSAGFRFASLVTFLVVCLAQPCAACHTALAQAWNIDVLER